MTKIPHNPFVLVDGSSYLFRAFHALPPLTNSKGMPTGAAYGVINMLRKLRKDYDPEYMAVVFDPKGKTFRNDMYSEYKANRPPMPDDLRVQIQPLFDIIKAMGLPLVIVDGVEADDVIGTLAQQATANGMHTLISTGDKDMAQLVNDKVTLINTMTNKVMDEAGVEEKFGLPPAQIIDYLALMGDTVDNVPGVPKVGPKTAQKWLAEYGSLDNVMANANGFKGKIGENLRNSLEQLPISKQLVTIKCDVALDESPSDLKPVDKDTAKLVEIFKELEFKSWLSELLGDSADEAPKETHYDIVLSEKDFDKWLNKLASAKQFAFDTETTSLNYMDAELVGVSFAVKAGEAAYVPFGHDYPGAPTQLSRDYVLDKLKPLLEDPKLEKIGHNFKYDLTVLANAGIDVQGVAYDTMLESYILAGGIRHDMDSLALKYLGHKTIHYEEVAGKGAKQITFNQVGLDEAGPYAAEDADVTLQLHEHLWPSLQKQKDLKDVFHDIEMPLVPVLSQVERNGVLIDAKKLQAQSKDLAARLDTLEQKAFKVAGAEFNLGSPKQLQEILYDKMGLPVLQKTPKGQPSTAEPVLQELALEYELPELILEYRSLSKLKSTYTDKLPLQVNQHTGRVHTSYHQAGAATGRFSSSDPNLQNIPVRTEEGRKIRQAFIAPKDYKIIAADYSQIELRIMAHMSGDKGLLDAFKNKLDIHRATAAEVFGLPLDKVTDNHRRSAKAINFGLIYGMSAFGLSKQLDIPRADAQKYMDLYFERYPGVQDYMDEVRELAHQQGYVETLFGRRLYLPEINSRNMQRQKAAERAAVNAPMQGTAADIIKIAMDEMGRYLVDAPIDAKMIMQVHDELVFEVADKDLDVAKVVIEETMDNAADLDVPLEVNIGVGSNWDEAH
ncbi:MAG: DNA polymerase I [Legionellales bacterium]|nr:DNA polymerase I [Legionellales bacterium]|tara:strand:+ start:7687 stop:10374 length:2688 start_codon:yes stop_codon:yes gene_type:complete